MKNIPNATAREKFADWLKNNIVHDIPVLGHTLTARSWRAFEHDMKHFFSMLLGMAAMLAIPMPMAEREHKGGQLAQEFIFMMLYMYIGMFIGSLVFNLGKTSLSYCKAVLYPAQIEADIENQGLLSKSTDSEASEPVAEFH